MSKSHLAPKIRLLCLALILLALMGYLIRYPDGSQAERIKGNGLITSGDQLSAAHSTPSRLEGRPDQLTKARISERYGKLPLSFEVNQGQTDSRVKFLSRGNGYNFFLTPTEAVLALSKRSAGASESSTGDVATEEGNARSGSTAAAHHAVVRVRHVGANPKAKLEGLDKLAGTVNYFVGGNAEQWRTSVAVYSKVRSRNVYPGIDVVYYGNQQELEYDFVVAPGAHPERIELAFEGADQFEVNSDGDLRVSTKVGDVLQRKPYVYQTINGERREVPSRYKLSGRDRIKFILGRYDASKPLVIDPVLAYSTYLGGSDNDSGSSIAVDASGNAYVTGLTLSSDFPVVPSAQPITRLNDDAFVTKLNPDGSAFVYSTYIGGTSSDSGNDIAVDSSGNAYVAGYTYSADFPLLNAVQSTQKGTIDAFVAKLNPTGTALLYSTYLGGYSHDTAFDLIVDNAGSAHLTGYTSSKDFPTANPLQGVKRGDSVFKSLNGGGSWGATNTGLSAAEVHKLAIDPTQPNTIYAGTENGVFKTVDGGSNWSVTDPGKIKNQVTDIAIDPTNPAIVYVATVAGVYKSTNGGNTWNSSDTGLISGQTVRVLAIDPSNTSVLLAGTPSNGIFRSTNAGANWQFSNGTSGLSSSTIYSLVFAPSISTIYAATSRGVYKSTNGGTAWVNTITNSNSSTPRATLLLVDPLNPTMLYADFGGQGGLSKSTNGGVSWTTLSTALAGRLLTLAISSSAPNTFYAGTIREGIYKSADGGSTWATINSGLTITNSSINTLLIDSNDANKVYAGASSGSDVFVTKLNPAGSALVYSTYIGGSGSERGAGIALDSNGSAYVAGSTDSPNFPTAAPMQAAKAGPFQNTSDAFILKLDPNGSGLTYSTYLGGNFDDYAVAVVVDPNGNAYLTGSTTSVNFPTVNPLRSYDPSDPAPIFSDVIVAKLNASGAALLYSTYLGGAANDTGRDIAIDNLGNAYVVGDTSSTDFPVANASQAARGGGSDAFATALKPTGSALHFSTYLGGSENESGNAIAVSAPGRIYLTGNTLSYNFPTANPLLAEHRGVFYDGFVASFDIQHLVVSPQPTPTPQTVQLSQTSYNVNEGVQSGNVQLTVLRSGDSSQAASVSYSTSDTAGLISCNPAQSGQSGKASERCDYSTSLGTLRWAAGDASAKTLTIPIVNDLHMEGAETFTINLYEPAGVAIAGPTAVTITIDDDETAQPTQNPIDAPAFFINQQYLDFLGRSPDQTGFNNWMATLQGCPGGGYGTGNADCDRIKIAMSTFQSVEVQTRGYWAYRFYEVAYGRRPSYAEFIPDMAQVGGPKSPQEEALAKDKFMNDFMQRAEFVARYASLTAPSVYVDTMLQTAGLSNLSIRNSLVSALENGQKTRAQILREIVETKEVEDKFYVRGFVSMMYYGFLRRDPDPVGFQNYVDKLNAQWDPRGVTFDFIYSSEYMGRFGKP
jgi:photosystem II stability/assembly factor-like uncharacterized protein